MSGTGSTMDGRTEHCKGVFGQVVVGAPPAKRAGSLVYHTVKQQPLSPDEVPDGDRLALVEHSCRCWACPTCGRMVSARLRDRVLPHIGMFKIPRLITLTCRRDFDATGEAAFDRIQSAGYHWRILRALGFKKALKCLAFHPESPDWPHWHILVDLADLRKDWKLVMRRLWRLWRDKWGIGRPDLQLRLKLRTSTAEKCARYAISYQQRQGGVVPDWVKLRKRAPRAWEVYGKLRVAIRSANSRKARTRPKASTPSRVDVEPVDVEVAERIRSASRPLFVRLEECGQSVSLVAQRWRDGIAVSRFFGRIDASLRECRWSVELNRCVNMCREIRSYGDGDSSTRTVRLFVPLGAMDDAREVGDAIRRSLSFERSMASPVDEDMMEREAVGWIESEHAYIPPGKRDAVAPF